jgi:hypothetical protein
MYKLVFINTNIFSNLFFLPRDCEPACRQTGNEAIPNYTERIARLINLHGRSANRGLLRILQQ